MRIRNANVSDLPAVADTLSRCVAWLNNQGIDQWDGRYPKPRKFAEDIKNGNLILLEFHGVVVGTVALDSRPDPEYADVAWSNDGKSAGVVHRLMIRPEYQGRGFARLMMEHVEERARRLGYASIRLDAYTGNSIALRLYEKMGYSAVGKISLRKGEFMCFEKELLKRAPRLRPHL